MRSPSTPMAPRTAPTSRLPDRSRSVTDGRCLADRWKTRVRPSNHGGPGSRRAGAVRVTSKFMADAPARRRVDVRRVDECDTLHDLITHCFPAFGGAFLRRVYTILDRAIGMGCPLTVAVSGPVTVSGQHQAWLIPLLETGWVAYLSTTDAVCYHDGHRSLDAHRHGPVHEVPIWGDDGALRGAQPIRGADMAVDE